MNIESFRDLCLSLKGVTEEFPFDEMDSYALVAGGLSRAKRAELGLL